MFYDAKELAVVFTQKHVYSEATRHFFEIIIIIIINNKNRRSLYTY